VNDKSTSASEPRASLVIERTYTAKTEELWELWTTKSGFESWWGPVGFRVEVGAIESRVGGPLHYEMIADAPEQVAAMKKMGQPLSHKVRGMFSELEPLKRLTLTQVIDFLPGVTPYDSTIIMELFPSGERTRMVVTLHRLHDEMFTNMQGEGFTSQLSKLDKRFGWQQG
jgi:uncharacterized protein YndB with AHSA1/START domain